MATAHARAGWGINPAELEQQRRAFMERAWMTRNYPDYRPRSLFPEDYDQEEVTR